MLVFRNFMGYWLFLMTDGSFPTDLRGTASGMDPIYLESVHRLWYPKSPKTSQDSSAN